ncbi:hypothetical protein Dimus_015408 [Dionaea muscipula]
MRSQRLPSINSASSIEAQYNLKHLSDVQHLHHAAATGGPTATIICSPLSSNTPSSCGPPSTHLEAQPAFTNSSSRSMNYKRWQPQLKRKEAAIKGDRSRLLFDSAAGDRSVKANISSKVSSPLGISSPNPSSFHWSKPAPGRLKVNFYGSCVACLKKGVKSALILAREMGWRSLVLEGD